MQLADRTTTKWDEESFVVRITTDPSRPVPLRTKEALLVRDHAPACAGFKVYFSSGGSPEVSSTEARVIALPASLSYVRDGDIMTVRPKTGELRVMYRKTSRHNSVMFTPACNNFCVMCSQPPQRANDEIFR